MRKEPKASNEKHEPLRLALRRSHGSRGDDRALSCLDDSAIADLDGRARLSPLRKAANVPPPTATFGTKIVLRPGRRERKVRLRPRSEGRIKAQTMIALYRGD